MFEIMRAFDVRPSEQKQVLLLILHNMLIIAVTIVGKSVRDALFLTRFDKSLLPLMMCAVAVAVAVAMAILARMQSKVRPKYLLPVTAIVFAASIALIRLQLANWIVPVLYVWMEVINVLTVQQFWLLASDVCDARQAKRLFP